MTRKKILFISNKATRNGADRILINVVTYLDKSRFEPLVLLNTDGSSRKEFEEQAPTKLFYLDRPDKLSTLIRYFLPFLYNILKKRYFQKLITTFQPDIIYINTINNNIYTQLAISHKSLPKIVHVHETDFIVMYYYDYQWVNSLVSSVHILIACSAAVKDFFLRNFMLKNTQIEVIYESIDFNRFTTAIHTVEKSFLPEPKPADEIWIGASGQPQFRKGTDLFIEIAYLLCQKKLSKKVRFFWVGGTIKLHQDPYIQTMYFLIKKYGLEDTVSLVTEKENLYEFYQKIDIYLITSREDPFPLSMIEAAYYNKKLFGYRVSGVPELLEQVGGTIVDVVSAGSMAESLYTYLSENHSYTPLASSSILKETNMEYSIKQIERIISSL